MSQAPTRFSIEQSKLAGRILSLLKPENGGDRKRSVLVGIAGGEEKLAPVLDSLLASGAVVWKRCQGMRLTLAPKVKR